jgi:hypothetical protein
VIVFFWTHQAYRTRDYNQDIRPGVLLGEHIGTRPLPNSTHISHTTSILASVSGCIREETRIGPLSYINHVANACTPLTNALFHEGVMVAVLAAGSSELKASCALMGSVMVPVDSPWA